MDANAHLLTTLKFLHANAINDAKDNAVITVARTFFTPKKTDELKIQTSEQKLIDST